MGCAYLCLQICSIEGMDVVDRPFRDIVVEYVSRGDHPSATAQTIVSVKLLTAICCVWCVCLCVRVCACVCFNSIASGPRPLRVGVLSKRCPSVQLLTSEWNRRRYNSLSRADFLSTLFHEVRAVTVLVPHWCAVLPSTSSGSHHRIAFWLFTQGTRREWLVSALFTSVREGRVEDVESLLVKQRGIVRHTGTGQTMLHTTRILPPLHILEQDNMVGRGRFGGAGVVPRLPAHTGTLRLLF